MGPTISGVGMTPSPAPPTPPPVLVALDPGKWKMGLCVLHKGRLHAAKPIYIPRRGAWSETAAVNAVIEAAPWIPTGVWRWDLERPRVYPGKGRSAMQEDVELLTGLVDRLARELRPLGADVHLHAPYAWKRSLPKAIHHRRVMAALDASEVAYLNTALTKAGKARLDVLDAVGLALFGAGRVGVGGSRVDK